MILWKLFDQFSIFRDCVLYNNEQKITHNTLYIESTQKFRICIHLFIYLFRETMTPSKSFLINFAKIILMDMEVP